MDEHKKDEHTTDHKHGTADGTNTHETKPTNTEDTTEEKSDEKPKTDHTA